METLISPKKASEILGVTVKSLANSRYTKTGIDVQYIKIGRVIRYKKTDIEAYIEANTFNHARKAQVKEALWNINKTILHYKARIKQQ